MSNQRFESGLKKLQEIDGEAGQKVIESLAAISPDLAKMIIEFGFGEVYQRPGLDLRSRELATVAALTALGCCQPQLNVHINGALNVGCEPQEITETIIQIALYAGFPACLNAMFVAKEVFIERGIISE
ncbi:MAG: 4-carboxymuconolactone decarboxylase [Oceanicoccus sp.]|jgi:4-carboxymuconolactone decarboxylase